MCSLKRNENISRKNLLVYLKLILDSYKDAKYNPYVDNKRSTGFIGYLSITQYRISGVLVRHKFSDFSINYGYIFSEALMLATL